MENMTSWQSIDPHTSSHMAEARRQAHNAIHWLARLAHSYVDREPNDRHTDLLWDVDRATIRTQPFQGNLSVELHVADLELVFCEDGKPVPHLLSLQERTPAHIEAWVLVELLHRGVDRDRFSKDLPYAARDLMLGDSEDHEVENFRTEFSTLNGWLRNAAAVCTALRHELKREILTGGTAIPPLVCWPETFQLGIEIALPQGFGAPALRAGLSAGDALRPDPFFFVGTIEQTMTADIDAGSLLSVQRIQSECLSADDVIGFLRGSIQSQRKRLAG